MQLSVIYLRSLWFRFILHSSPTGEQTVPPPAAVVLHVGRLSVGAMATVNGPTAGPILKVEIKGGVVVKKRPKHQWSHYCMDYQLSVAYLFLISSSSLSREEWAAWRGAEPAAWSPCTRLCPTSWNQRWKTQTNQLENLIPEKIKCVFILLDYFYLFKLWHNRLGVN